MHDAPLQPDIVDVARSVDEVRIAVGVPAGLFWFRGHFPEYPVLPGVVQLDWAIRWGRQHFALSSTLQPATVKVKYREVIRPEDRLTIVLGWNAAQRRLGFEYRGGEQLRSSGQVSFA
jgi:3-hydroxymyristoyl/3-hydroxydecanoyl-(acyl carrier protein) dehydratase